MATALTLLALTLLAVAGWVYTNEVYLYRLNTRSPYAPLGPGPEPLELAAPARQLLVFLVDGLRDDTALAQPMMAALAARGVAARLMACVPSFTDPGMASIATGQPPLTHGLRINLPTPPGFDLDSVSKRALAEGRRVAIASQGDPDIRRLLFIPEAADELAGVPEARAALAAGAPALIWVYQLDCDMASHTAGAYSARNEAAARACDERLAELLEGFDFQRDAAVVLSDHGHLPSGGHGGFEREARRGIFIAAGGPFAEGGAWLGERPLDRVAATLSAALGQALPERCEGAALSEAFAETSGLASAAAAPAEDPRVEAAEARARRRAAALGAVAAVAAIACGLGLSATPMRLGLADFEGLARFAAVFAVITTIIGWPLSFSLPRGGPGYIAEIWCATAISGAIAFMGCDASRRLAEAAAVALTFAPLYITGAAYVGTDLRRLPRPPLGFAFLLVSSLSFFVPTLFGARLILELTGALR